MARNRMYSALRGRMTERNVTQADIAKCLGVSVQAVNKKFNGIYGFSQEDVLKICKLLGISIEEIGLFFYAQKVYEA